MELDRYRSVPGEGDGRLPERVEVLQSVACQGYRPETGPPVERSWQSDQPVDIGRHGSIGLALQLDRRDPQDGLEEVLGCVSREHVEALALQDLTGVSVFQELADETPGLLLGDPEALELRLGVLGTFGLPPQQETVQGPSRSDPATRARREVAGA